MGIRMHRKSASAGVAHAPALTRKKEEKIELIVAQLP
jgi:hypothetical protein